MEMARTRLALRVVRTIGCTSSTHAAKHRLDRRLRDASGVSDLGHGVIGGPAHVPDCVVTCPPRLIEREFGGLHPFSEPPQILKGSVRGHSPEV
jgi:hypothetical protein